MVKLIIVLALLGACSAPAETYVQSPTKTNVGAPGQWGCKLNTYECLSIPLTSGDTYGFNEFNGVLLPNYQFVFDSTHGVVETVTEQPPSFGNGLFSFTFSLSDGRTGTVTGVFVLHQVGRAKYAAVEGSIVDFN